MLFWPATGGDNISVSVGVVSRVEPQQYVHGAASLLAIQIDAVCRVSESVCSFSPCNAEPLCG